VSGRTGTGEPPVITEDEPGRGSGLFAALGRFVVHHPWMVIGAWIIAAVAVIATPPSPAMFFSPSPDDADRQPRLVARPRRPARGPYAVN
jgi:hypothetical protein